MPRGNAPETSKNLLLSMCQFEKDLDLVREFKHSKCYSQDIKPLHRDHLVLVTQYFGMGIPDRLKSIENFNVFKLNLKTYLFHKYYK